VVLVHGLSRVVVTVLKAAMDAGKNITVVVKEGRPELLRGLRT
jgi:translation initiation factor 2B subunit (eIF-2B alpha/beta/delta family)